MGDTNMKRRRIRDGFPQPIVVPPLELPHLHTFILLHGRGSNAEHFRRSLLHHPIPEYNTLRKAFPQAKFVFPTAAFSPTKVFKRLPITQWFDYWPLTESGKNHEPEIDALRQSCDFVHSLIHRAIGEVGAANVIVGGLSQGCATSLVSMLLWDGPQIAACVGICGWLPFRDSLTHAIEDSMEANDDVFNSPAKEVEKGDTRGHARVMKWLLTKLYNQDVSLRRTPSPLVQAIFLAHGALDEKVPVVEGRKALEFLSKVGAKVTYKEYEEVGHWYTGHMLQDLIEFVRQQLPSGATYDNGRPVRSAL